MTTPPGGPSQKASAVKMRRTRQRRRAGLFGVVPWEVRRVEIGALVRRGLLVPEDQADRFAIAQAIGRLLDLTL